MSKVIGLNFIDQNLYATKFIILLPYAFSLLEQYFLFSVQTYGFLIHKDCDELSDQKPSFLVVSLVQTYEIGREWTRHALREILQMSGKQLTLY